MQVFFSFPGKGRTSGADFSIVLNKKGAAGSSDRSLFRILLVTVHSYLFASRFHARMKICLQKGTKGAPFYEQK